MRKNHPMASPFLRPLTGRKSCHNLQTGSLATTAYCYHCQSTQTHTHVERPLSGTTRVSRYQKGKPIWILLKQETVSGSGISWAICKSAPCSRQITMPAPHHSVFLQARCPSCRTINSIKALKKNLMRKKSPNGLTISSSSNRIWMEELSQPRDWFSGYSSLLLSLSVTILTSFCITAATY